MKKTFLSVLCIAGILSLLFVKQPVHADIYSQYKSVTTGYWDWPSRSFSLPSSVNLTEITTFYSSYQSTTPIVDESRDNGYAMVPLGFTYTFNGAQYDRVYVSINGFVTFGKNATGQLAGQQPPPSGSNIANRPQILFDFNDSYPSNIIAPFLGDHKFWTAQDVADAQAGLNPAGCTRQDITPSSISYGTLQTVVQVEEGGVLVDREISACIIQWDDLNVNWRTGSEMTSYTYHTGNVASFQLIIYEGVGAEGELQGNVEFRYGQHGSDYSGAPESSDWFHAAVGAKGEIATGHGRADFINALYNGNNEDDPTNYEWIDLDKQRTSDRINRGWVPSGDVSKAILLTANPWSGGDESWGDGDANMSRIDPTGSHFGSTDTRQFATISDIIAILRSATTDNKLNPDYKQAAFHGDVHHDGRYYYLGSERLYALYRNDNWGTTDRVGAELINNNITWCQEAGYGGNPGIANDADADAFMAGNARISKDTFYLKKVNAVGNGGFSNEWGRNDEYLTIDLRDAIRAAITDGVITPEGRYNDYRQGNGTQYTVDFNNTIKTFKVVDLANEDVEATMQDYQLRITLEDATMAEKSLLWILTSTPYQNELLYTFKLRKNIWWSNEFMEDVGDRGLPYVIDHKKELFWEADELDASIILSYLGGKVIGLPWWNSNVEHNDKEKSAVSTPYKLADNISFDNVSYSTDDIVIPVYYNGIASDNQSVSFTFNGEIADLKPATSDVMVSYDNTTHKVAIISDGYFTASSPVAYITVDNNSTSFEATKVKFYGKRVGDVACKLNNSLVAGNADVSAYNQPNPATNYTDFVVDIATNGNYKLTVFDVNGNPVKVVANGTFSAGTMNFNWDITNQAGDKVANGTYFYTLEGDNVLITKSLVIAR